MPQLSIRTRINLLIGGLLVLALLANVAVIVRSAGPRIRAEDESMMVLTRQTVEHVLADMQSAADPAREMAALLDRLAVLRHAQVTFEPAGSTAPRRDKTATRPTDAPSWFRRLIAADRRAERVPARIGANYLGDIVVTSNPADEIGEIWQSVSETAVGGLVLIGLVFGLTTLAVRQALRPINDLGRGLTAMEKGNYAVEVATSGPPELASISAKLNDLATALTATRAENSRLAGEIVSLEDRERRELARELHDEFGPYLFAIRANIAALLADPGLDDESRRKGQAALDHAATVQQLNRRILKRLSPPALSEFGLEQAVAGMVALWREENPGTAITLDVDLAATPVDETTGLTVFRVVQEGITNALRHAAAASIAITIAADPAGELRIEVADDGRGLDGGLQPGFGLSGMRERVWALGGVMTMANGADKGVVLNVTLPRRTATRSQSPAPAT